jgi:hypothetical protein
MEGAGRGEPPHLADREGEGKEDELGRVTDETLRLSEGNVRGGGTVTLVL